jgi:hypothetical protein
MSTRVRLICTPEESVLFIDGTLVAVMYYPRQVGKVEYGQIVDPSIPLTPPDFYTDEEVTEELRRMGVWDALLQCMSGYVEQVVKMRSRHKWPTMPTYHLKQVRGEWLSFAEGVEDNVLYPDFAKGQAG